MAFAWNQLKLMAEDIQHGLGIVLHYDQTLLSSNQQPQPTNLTTIDNIHPDNCQACYSHSPYQLLLIALIEKLNQDVNIKILISIFLSAATVIFFLYNIMGASKHEKKQSLSERERELVDQLWRVNIIVDSLTERLDQESNKVCNLRQHLMGKVARLRHLSLENCTLWSVTRQLEQLVLWSPEHHQDVDGPPDLGLLLKQLRQLKEQDTKTYSPPDLSFNEQGDQ